MSNPQIPSPARSQGAISSPRQYKPRRSRSVSSPAKTDQLRLTAIISESFVLSPLSKRKSILPDDTGIEAPSRKSWWKRLDEHSRDVMAVLQTKTQLGTNNVEEEYMDVEILSQEKKNFTLDLPESSDGESICSIVIPHRKLFNQKDIPQKNNYVEIINKREALAKQQQSNIDFDKELDVRPKNLFSNKPRSKPIFPSALLNISADKTVNKTKVPVLENAGNVRNLFGSRPATKRKNMFADFIVSDSEDEIPEIQAKVFGFKKIDVPNRRESTTSQKQHSPTSSITDIDIEDWKLLPSSTMVGHQLEIASTPNKRARLSKLMEIKETETQTKNTSINKSSSSKTSKNKSKSLSNSKTKNDLESALTSQDKVNKPNQHTTSINKLQAEKRVSNIIHTSVNENRSVLEQMKIDTEKNDLQSKEINKILYDKSVNNLQIQKNNSHSQKELLFQESQTEQVNIIETDEENREITDTLSHKNKNETNLTTHEKNIKTSVSAQEIEIEEDRDEDFTLEYENDEEIFDNKNDNSRDLANEMQGNKTLLNKTNANEALNLPKEVFPDTNVSQPKVQSIIDKETYCTNENNVSKCKSINKTLNTEKNYESTTQAGVDPDDHGMINEENFTDKSKHNDKSNIDSDLTFKNKDDLISTNKSSEKENLIFVDESTNFVKGNNEEINALEKRDKSKKNEHLNTDSQFAKQIHNTDDKIIELEQSGQKENDNENDKEETEQEITEIVKSKKDDKIESEKKEKEREKGIESKNNEVEIDKNKDKESEKEEIEHENEEELERENHAESKNEEVKSCKDKESQKEEEIENKKKEDIESEDVEEMESDKVEKMESKKVEEMESEKEEEMESEKEEQIECESEHELESEKHHIDIIEENDSKEKEEIESENESLESEEVEEEKSSEEGDEIEGEKDEDSGNEENLDIDEQNEMEQSMDVENKSEEEDEQHENKSKTNVEESENEEHLEENQSKSQTEDNKMSQLVDKEQDNEVDAESDAENETDNDEQVIETSDNEEDNVMESDDTQSDTQSEDDNADADKIQNSDNDEHELENEPQEHIVDSRQYDERENYNSGESNDKNEVSGVKNSKQIPKSVNMSQDKENTLKSPEAIRHDRTNRVESTRIERRDSSVRKTKSMIKPLSARPSLAPVRESTGLSDGTKDSSAEGSGWDSHRTTRKTLRQTFGKDFTPRKSLRALVMEKSAKRQTDYQYFNNNRPQSNSTELPEQDSIHDNEPVYIDESPEVSEQSNHDVSKRTRLTNLEMCLQRIRDENIELRKRVEEEVRNSLKAPPKEPFSIFKVPNKPVRRALKPIQSKAKCPQSKFSQVPIEVPAEILEDMKYKPPKKFKPSNAAWVTKRLYKFLEDKLEPKYDYKARVRAEKLVETIYNFTKHIRRYEVAPTDAVDILKQEMARLEIVKTHHEFYLFFHEYMPREVRIKVIPDIVNKISLPRHGVFTDILR